MSGVCLLAIIVFFKDTFRKERSLIYQTTFKQLSKERVRAVQEKSSCKSNPDVFADVKLTLQDVSPFRPIYLVIRRWNNLATLFASGNVAESDRPPFSINHV
jgi:hypothetical protein